jgi:hypothetical protein
MTSRDDLGSTLPALILGLVAAFCVQASAMLFLSKADDVHRHGACCHASLLPQLKLTIATANASPSQG